MSHDYAEPLSAAVLSNREMTYDTLIAFVPFTTCALIVVLLLITQTVMSLSDKSTDRLFKWIAVLIIGGILSIPVMIFVLQ